MNRSLLLILVSVPFLTYTNADLYREYAEQWAGRYIYDAHGKLRISPDDFEAIKQLVDCSLHRSTLTLAAQQQAWQTVTLLWQGWQNFAQTRLNPSKDRPYLIAPEEKNVSTQDFWDILAAHEEVCKEYGHMVGDVVYGDTLEDALAKEAVNQMRQEARICMLDALTDVKKQLEGLYDITFNKSLDPLLEALEEDESGSKRFNISSFLMNYIPNLVVHKFVEADALYNTLSEEGWTVLEKVQLIGNQAWHAIETARSHFYRALLDELTVAS